MKFKVGDLVRCTYDDGDYEWGFVTGFDDEKDPIVFWFKEERHIPIYANDVVLLSRKNKKS
jgi:hypothetical protein